MGKRKRTPVRCIAYLHANDCPSAKAFKVESTQLRFLNDYANSHSLSIEKIIRGNAMGPLSVNRHFGEMLKYISLGYYEGILVVNMRCLDRTYEGALAKVSKVIMAGGFIYSAEDGGKLGSRIHSFEGGRRNG